MPFFLSLCLFLNSVNVKEGLLEFFTFMVEAETCLECFGCFVGASHTIKSLALAEPALAPFAFQSSHHFSIHQRIDVILESKMSCRSVAQDSGLFFTNVLEGEWLPKRTR
ncbi:hypothetical protein BCR43DRAFT_70611 [Syncephalastrum racemosum]|uniref:Secreted protein n=1 Tax=Syncephalastrum racemosum TaxID=13706 RepID=A0A1X2HWM6_SYNRA|nr:hypothetical protein BCR43DRAFT_70611 [Syncephalastrum racemosum]